MPGVEDFCSVDDDGLGVVGAAVVDDDGLGVDDFVEGTEGLSVLSANLEAVLIAAAPVSDKNNKIKFCEIDSFPSAKFINI